MEKDTKMVYCDCETIHEDILNEVRENMPEDAYLYELADLFKVFADSTRVKILWALEQSEMCVCDMAVLLGMTKSAISHQLRTLKQTNLVKFRKEGKNVFYSLKDDHVKKILQMGMEHIHE
ncbi:MAG: ArsR/SmtB family transcription factor [Proteocatella sp.]